MAFHNNDDFLSQFQNTVEIIRFKVKKKMTSLDTNDIKRQNVTPILKNLNL